MLTLQSEPTSSAGSSLAAEDEGLMRWTDESVKLLISLYHEHEHKFADVNFENKSVWEAIAKGMKQPVKCVPAHAKISLEHGGGQIGHNIFNITGYVREAGIRSVSRKSSANPSTSSLYSNEISPSTTSDMARARAATSWIPAISAKFAQFPRYIKETW